MEPQIIDKDAFAVIGIELRTTTKDGRNFAEIPRFWQQVMEQGQIDRIPDRQSPDAILGICMDFDADGSFSYIIGAEVTATERTPDDMVMRTIPAGRYAVFTAHGKMPDAIQQTTRSIYSEWLPNSPYRHAGFADYELYDARFEDPDDPLIEIYVSIVET